MYNLHCCKFRGKCIIQLWFFLFEFFSDMDITILRVQIIKKIKQGKDKMDKHIKIAFNDIENTI